MKIKWNTIIGMGMLLFALTLVIKNSAAVVAILGAIQQIGPEHNSSDRVAGVAIIGVLLVTLVVLVKMLTQNNGSDS